MKTSKVLMSLASIGLGFSMLTGCGGGSDSTTTPTTPPTSETGLDSQKVNETVTRLADTFGCEYSVVATAESKKFNVVLSYESIEAIKDVLERESVFKSNSLIASTSPVIAAKTAEEIQGDCGGTLLMETEENAEGTEATYDLTFTNYCNSEATGEKTTLNGSLNGVLSQTSETSMTITAWTETPLNIKTINPNTSKSMDTTIDLENAKVIVASDTSGNYVSAALTASSIKVTDHISGEVCTASDVDASYDVATQATEFSATVLCSGDTGKLEISGTADANGQLNMEVTDINGKKGNVTSTDTEGVFNVSFDSANLGTMDCSMIDVPAQ